MMKKHLTIFIGLFLFQTISAQVDNNVSIFHRVLVLNSNNELMVVKIKDTDFWVTPGFYQTKEQSIKKEIIKTSESYGLKISDQKLKGVFLLKRENDGKKSTSLRNVFIVKMKSGKIKLPKGIEDIKWLPVNKAVELISFPHINLMIERIMKNNDKTWGGTLLQFKENGKWKVRVLEEFYSL